MSLFGNQPFNSPNPCEYPSCGTLPLTLYHCYYLLVIPVYLLRGFLHHFDAFEAFFIQIRSELLGVESSKLLIGHVCEHVDPQFKGKFAHVVEFIVQIDLIQVVLELSISINGFLNKGGATS